MFDDAMRATLDEMHERRRLDEQSGFDTCLGMLCKLGHEEIARAVVDEAERLGVNMRHRRSRCRVRVNLDPWPSVYGEGE